MATKAASEFSELSGFCDGVAGPSPEEFAERRERCRAALRSAQADAVLLEASTSLEYLTGLRWRRSERPLLFVLPVKGTPFWVSPKFEEGTVRESGVGTDELRLWEEHESPYDRVAQGLSDRGLAAGTLAIEPTTRSFVVEGVRSKSVGTTLLPAHPVVSECRMTKTEAELSRLRRANEATKAALAQVAARVEVGMSEAEVESMVRAAQSAAGLSDIWALVAFGQAAAFPHGTQVKHPLRSGEMVLVDTGGKLHGYSSDITRTWPVGAISSRQKKAWEAVLLAQSAALEHYRAGSAPAQADRAARASIEASGFGTGYAQFT
ncbi:MAG: Xaa-Pro peptidase family protein, partial [Myxococcota bacterium]